VLPKIRKAPLRTAEAAFYEPDAALARRLRVQLPGGEELDLGQRRGSLLLAPRAICPLGSDARTRGRPFTAKSLVKPRSDDQERVLREAGELVDAGRSFVLRAGTGFGKTAVALDLIARAGRQALVVVPKEDLLEQWIEEARKFLGLRRSDVGIIRQNTFQPDRPVVVAMIHSLSRDGRYPPAFRSNFGVVVWDECHRVPAPTFAGTATMFPALVRIGMTATPERFDGREVLTKAHVGPVEVESTTVKVPPRVALYETPWKLPRRKDGQPWYHEAGKCGHVLTHLSQHGGRNRLIARVLERAYRSGRRTVVFSDRVDHLDLLRSMVRRAGAPEEDTALYVHGISKAQRRDYLRRPLIFATYAMMDTGTNAPWLDCCVLATPRSNVEQAVGRVQRELEGKPQPVVVDFLDDASPVFAGYARKRIRTYRRLRATEVKRYRLSAE